MRARYYSPEMRRFINADIIPGEISNAITLNRFAYANGNPVSNVDPFGLSAERGSAETDVLSVEERKKIIQILNDAVLNYQKHRKLQKIVAANAKVPLSIFNAEYYVGNIR